MSLEAWTENLAAPAGVGIDLVNISELQALDTRTKGVFSSRTFTPRELAEADCSPDRWVYLAGRFAAKEAVFKAVAHLLPERTFDFRLVESLHRADGSPYVCCEGKLREILDAAGVASLLLSISNEDHYAIALVQAVKDCRCQD